MIARHRLSRILLLVVTTISTMTHAASEKRVSTLARWEGMDKNRLVINVADLLTPAQRDIINSGFTTFSVFTVGETKDQAKPLIRLSCTVKYDTWEERYEVSRIDPAPVVTETVKDYKSWSGMCLEITIEDPKLLATVSTESRINGTLNIRQSTPEESAKIKSWLVKQQSGFMQGLYSHMLGNFQYQNRSIIQVQIPQKSSAEAIKP